MTTRASRGRKSSQSNQFQRRYPENYWDGGADYLRQCTILQHNADYLEFLVTRVWKLDAPCRLVEFGCGAGKMGFLLMPLLAGGSSYTGVDLSASLVAEGQGLMARAFWPARFSVASIYETPFPENSFDLAISHTVLMHVPHPERVLEEMIRVTKPGGMVITCEANRNAHTALLHIEEVNHQDETPLNLFQTINREIRKRTGVDHNIGAKLPVLMHRAGLKQVQVRISDAARFLGPPLDTADKRALFKAICDEGYGIPTPNEEQRQRWKANIMQFGISTEEAEAEIARELAEDFLHKGDQYHTVYASLLTWSFGVVEK